MDEHELVERAQAGDVEAFGGIMDLHLRRVRAFIAMKAPIPDLIDEVAHETFVQAFRSLSRFQAGTALGAWLVGIAHNLLREEFRRRQRGQRQRRLDEVVLFSDPRHAAEPAAVDHLERCLDDLAPLARNLVSLRYRDACSPQQIAARLGRTPEWVRVTLHRLRAHLRACIERRLAEEP